MELPRLGDRSSVFAARRQGFAQNRGIDRQSDDLRRSYTALGYSRRGSRERQTDSLRRCGREAARWRRHVDRNVVYGPGGSPGRRKARQGRHRSRSRRPAHTRAVLSGGDPFVGRKNPPGGHRR